MKYIETTEQRAYRGANKSPCTKKGIRYLKKVKNNMKNRNNENNLNNYSKRVSK